MNVRNKLKMNRICNKPGTIELGACEVDEIRAIHRIDVHLNRQGIKRAGQIMDAGLGGKQKPARVHRGHLNGAMRGL